MLFLFFFSFPFLLSLKGSTAICDIRTQLAYSDYPSEMTLSDVPRCSPFEEYRVDQILTLNVRPEHDHDHVFPRVIHARIREIHTRTLSCTMVVDILDDSQPPTASSTAFLKLFDRRFADQLRRDNGIELWTKDTEQADIRSVESGSIHQFLHDLHHTKGFQQNTEEDWDDAQNEAFLADELLGLYKTETATYDALRHYQGRLIPRLLAAVDLDLTPPNKDLDASGQGNFEPFQIKGILLQYINGFSLWNTPDHAPQSSWQDIVDQAVTIVRILGDHNILNKDVRPENFIVSTAADGHEQQQRYHVFMIDFALCRFRGEDESDLDWGRAKHSKDEEGAVALRMKKKLFEDYNFQLRYEDSLRYIGWAETADNFRGHAIKTELRPGVALYSLAPNGGAG